MGLALLILMCSICSITTDAYGSKMGDIKALSEILLQNYSKYAVPDMTSGAFNITVLVTLIAAGEIDEIEEKISAVMHLSWNWNDESIQWNETETGISKLSLGWADVWTPVLWAVNAHTAEDGQRKDRSHDAVTYRSSGFASFQEMVTIRTSCKLDMTYFPFDIQTCDIIMYIVSMSSFAIDAYVHEFFRTTAANHGSWNLLSKDIESSYSLITIQLKFERRPLFMLVNILLPIIVLAMLTPIVFVLPKKSGERVGYAITMLLAISVYMTIVSDHLPQNSQPMPLVSIMMFIWYILDASIVFIVIINTKVNTIGDSKTVPYMLRKFVLLTRKCACHSTKKDSGDDKQKEDQKCADVENQTEKDGNDTDEESVENSPDPAVPDKITWQDLSHAMDKWCFVLSYLLKVAIPITFLSISTAHRNNALE